MVFTAQQTTAFFEDANQMSIPNRTRLQLVNEGISYVDDLKDFSSEDLEQIAKNLRSPGSTLNAAGTLIPTAPFTIGAKSIIRLKSAAIAVRYYETVGRSTDPANMRWTVIKNLVQAWDALKNRSKDDKPEIPKLTKNTSVPKWYESLRIVLTRITGVRNIPLIYVLRDTVAVPAAAPPLLANQPYSDDTKSVANELIARASHTHPQFDEDNAKVLSIVDEAVRGTIYSSAISSARRSQNGRSAVNTIITQYAGKDKWLAERKRADDTIRTSKWLGNTNYKLEAFVTRHRNAYNLLAQCADHVVVELPTEERRVELLMEAIRGCNDVELRAAAAAIKQNEDPAGPKYNFEEAASILQEADPVVRKDAESKRKRPSVQISDTSGQPTSATRSTTPTANVGATGAAKTPGVGKTGVEFRYYKAHEWRALSEEQRNELKAYHKEQKSKRQKTGTDSTSLINAKGKPSKSLSKLVSMVIAEKQKESEQEDAAASLAQLMLASVSNLTQSQNQVQQAAQVAVPSQDPNQTAQLQKTIQGILKLKKSK